MFNKLVLLLAVFAIMASAGTVPGTSHYRITLMQPATVHGTVLKPGDYNLVLNDTKLTFMAGHNKSLVEVTVKIETAEKKFDSTSVRLDTESGKAVMAEIRLGGTKTTLVLN